MSQAGPSTRSTSNLEAGPFVLRPLFKGVPLSADGTSKDIKINCVDYLGTIASHVPQWLVAILVSHLRFGC